MRSHWALAHVEYHSTCCAAFLKRPTSFSGKSPMSLCFLMDGQHYRRTGSTVLHFADDFGGQAFHLLGVVEEQSELDEFGSRIRDLAQTCDAG